MLIYRPWIEIVDNVRGEYTTYDLKYYVNFDVAEKELKACVDDWAKDRLVSIVDKGIKEIEVVE